MNLLEGKVALVTGGSSGIGLAVVKEFLKNGAKGVTIADVDNVKGEDCLTELHKIYGKNKVIYVHADVTSDSSFEGAFKKTVEFFKQLDIVMNNAGIVDESNWSICVDINLKGVIRGTKLAMEEYLLKYKSGEEGIVINIASVLGLVPFPSTPIYSTTKHGIIGFSRSMGSPFFFEQSKVRVLTICPGKTFTSIFRNSIIDDPAVLKILKTEMKNMPGQTAEAVAMCVTHVLRKGENGSVWIIENGLSFEYQSQELESLKKYKL